MREIALRAFWMVIERATSNDAVVQLSVRRWLDEGSTDEGGSRWLACMLGLRPSVLDKTMREYLAATPRKRSDLRTRIRRLLDTKDDGTTT